VRTKSSGPIAASPYWLALLLAGIAFLIYLPSLHSGFVYDGPLLIQEGFFTSISNLGDVLSFKVLSSHLMLADRPGQLLYLMLIAAVSGTEPFLYHLCDNVLHAANVAMLFVFFLQLVKAEFPDLIAGLYKRVLLAAGVVTLIFGLHPLTAEPVSAISYSSDLLVTFFTLGALLAAVAFNPANTKSAFVAGSIGTLCAFAAVTCKESGLGASALLIVYWFLFRRREKSGPWLCFLGVAASVTLVFLAARFLLTPPPENPINTPLYLGGSFAQALWIQPRLWVFMMGKIICPASLSADYTLENVGLSSPIALAILAVVLSLQAWLAMKSRIGAMGVAIYWLGLVTVSNFIPLHRIVGDRFYYLPMIGVAMQLFALLLMTLKSRDGFWGAMTPCLVVLLPFTALTIIRENVFTGESTLWTDTAQVSPYSSKAHCNLGVVLAQQGRLDEAITQFQQGLAINRTQSEPYNNLGNIFLKKGRLDDAIAQYEKALEIAPNVASTHTNLGNALLKNSQAAEAIEQFQESLRLNPGDPDVRQYLTNAQALASRSSPVK
jgi:protein O-mannosyl-transferase